jgi:hypothetical protein
MREPGRPSLIGVSIGVYPRPSPATRLPQTVQVLAIEGVFDPRIPGDPRATPDRFVAPRTFVLLSASRASSVRQRAASGLGGTERDLVTAED